MSNPQQFSDKKPDLHAITCARMNDKMLEELLTTCDGDGKALKIAALREVRQRAYNTGFHEGIIEGLPS